MLRSIDAEVLKAYDLPPRTERALLDYFSELRRPGPVNFSEYFPSSFKPFIPWHEFQSGEFRHASVDATLERLPSIDDPIITKSMAHLHETNPDE